MGRVLSSVTIALVLLSLVVCTPVAAQSDETTRAVIRLLEGSTFQRGCFAPCMCPIMEQQPIEGTFALQALGFDGLFHRFLVTEVDWNLPSFGWTITGSGTYDVGGEFVSEHRLALDLKVNDEPVERYDSGFVPGGSNFPVFDIVISIHGMYCYDTVIDVRAAPALQLDVSAGGLSWEPVAHAQTYDVVTGDLRVLGETQGDFTSATLGCLADEWPLTTLPVTETPLPGEGFWFLIRFIRGSAAESYDSGAPSQHTSRDRGIGLAPASCSEPSDPLNENRDCRRWAGGRRAWEARSPRQSGAPRPPEPEACR